MALGAVFAALNAMYTAVGSRAREIATLRAIGFGSGAIVPSIVVEALLLAILGGLLGGLISWLLFNGITVSSALSTGQLVFDLSVDARTLMIGIVLACMVGLFGGLFPAVRAARLPVATALRASQVA